MRELSESFGSIELGELCRALDASQGGLTSAGAAERLERFGPNRLSVERRRSRTHVFVAQLKSPLVILLLIAAVISGATGEWTDATMVLAIVLVTAVIGFRREYEAETAARALGARIKTRAKVLRDGRATDVPVEDVVPGDVILLAAGSLVPADARVLEATDCHVGEAALTGESFPVEKRAATLPAGLPLAERTNSVFLGTNVHSGTARCLVVVTGRDTRFGAIAGRLALQPPETEFDRGVRRFGYLLSTAMFVMVLIVFAAHMVRGRPPIETLLFAIALAVGLSPELLPAILTVNLARSAALMAERGVLVRRLNAIENLGSMDVLCTDKTGTLTEGVVRLDRALDPGGGVADRVLELAAINAELEAGLPSPLDDAILAARRPSARPEKLAEVPFDFVRKRVSVVVAEGDHARWITKGAFHGVLDACDHLPGGAPLDHTTRAALIARFDDWSGEGLRVLAVATRTLPRRTGYDRRDEVELEFAGFLTFLDRPKEGAARAIADLAALGVEIKLITGDHARVAKHVAGLVGLPADQVVTAKDLAALSDAALWHVAERATLFAEVDPNQKERILLALKKTGHVVGFLGDGVNDAPAMHAADTSLSVETAVDVARAAADFVLLERDLAVIERGIREGRKTFANTLKYILTTASANLGNTLSMAAASLFLPFLPLTAGQILLNNLLSDVPAIGIADDRVDPELVDRPRRWDMSFIARFMVEFGLLSSAFDLATFAALIWMYRASPELFRTGWFVESLLTELVIALVVRTRRPIHRSRPGRALLVSTAILIPLTFALPFVPHAALLGFVPPPPGLLGLLAGITVSYVAAAELMKRFFYRSRTGQSKI